MARFERRQFRDERLTVEGNEYINCDFTDCVMVFSAAEADSPSAMVGNRFHTGIAWTFDGPAKDTLEFLKALYHGFGEDGRARVEQIFDAIRRPG